jgi:hypothetical protein
MGLGNIIWVIFIIIFLVSGVRKMLEALQKEAQKGAARKPDFEASPSEVEEFLRNLQEARRQQGQVQAGPGRLQRVPRQGTRAQAPRPETPFWQEQAREQANEEGPSVPAVRPVRVRRREPRREPTVETLVAPPAGKEPAAPAVKPAAPPPPKLKAMSLRDAVIWSEILGAPLSMRPRGGGRMRQGRP